MVWHYHDAMDLQFHSMVMQAMPQNHWTSSPQAASSAEKCKMSEKWLVFSLDMRKITAVFVLGRLS